jgi:hypothetical protein
MQREWIEQSLDRAGAALMRRGLLAAGFLLAFVGAAFAQGCGNCIVPTAPVGTSTNQAASTAFVQNQIGAQPWSQASPIQGAQAAIVDNLAKRYAVGNMDSLTGIGTNRQADGTHLTDAGAAAFAALIAPNIAATYP